MTTDATRLTDEIAAMESALWQLIKLKDIKEQMERGKASDYLHGVYNAEKEASWQRAREAAINYTQKAKLANAPRAEPGMPPVPEMFGWNEIAGLGGSMISPEDTAGKWVSEKNYNKLYAYVRPKIAGGLPEYPEWFNAAKVRPNYPEHRDVKQAIAHYDALRTYATEEIAKLRADAERATKEACHIYYTAYHAGHNDTVEACYTDVLSVDADTYWADAVAELLAESAK